MAEELANTYACVEDPGQFLIHDIRFHRSLAAASGNPILATLVGMVSAMHYDLRSKTVRKAKYLREAADMHQKIFRAVRARKADAAREAMHEHILQAQRGFRLESGAERPGRTTPKTRANQTRQRSQGGQQDVKAKSRSSK